MCSEELHRVVVPGGRLSAWEPINRAREDFGVEELADTSMLGADYERVRAHQYECCEAIGAMVGFDERDLVRRCMAAGFAWCSMLPKARPVAPVQGALAETAPLGDPHTGGRQPATAPPPGRDRAR